MSHDHDRNGCALHGALRLFGSIERVAPILHASAGCSLGAWAGEGGCGAGESAGLWHREVSSTLLQEKQVVFGGTSRLREQIKNAVKVISADLYAVITGCVPEVIGDDVPAMVKEAREQEFPVVNVRAPGFTGNAWRGYAQAAKALLQQLLDEKTRTAPTTPTVTILGLVPGRDVTWDGDLREIEALFARVGIRSNRLIGFGQGVEAWRSAINSSAVVTLSPWGRPAAELLRERLQIPVIDFPWLPIGSQDAGELLTQVGQALSLDAANLASVRQSLDRELRYYVQRAVPLLSGGDVQRRVAIVAGSALAVGLARFLSGTLGQLVDQVIITDDVDESGRSATLAAISESSARLAEVAFATGRLEIAALLRKGKPEVILGSALEGSVAEDLKVPHLEVAAPVRGRPFLQRSYLGVRGAVALIEDYLAAVGGGASMASGNNGFSTIKDAKEN